MSQLIFIQTDEPGQITSPNVRRVKIISGDNLATVTTAGYLNPANLQGYVIQNTDIIDMWYGAVASVGQQISSPGTYGEFLPSISNGVITLSQQVSSGNVLLPVVSGDYAIFNGTSGQIKDSSQASSNASNPFVVSSPGSLTTDHIAQIADANGSIKDGGVLGTAASKASSSSAATVASVSGATVTGNLLKAADTAGTIADAAFALHAATTAAFAGGGTSNAFTTTNMTASSIVTATILSQTNAASIVKAVPGTNTLTVTFSADPGANTTVSWISVTPAG